MICPAVLYLVWHVGGAQPCLAPAATQDGHTAA